MCKKKCLAEGYSAKVAAGAAIEVMPTDLTEPVPWLVPFPEPSQRCYTDGSSLAQAPPCSEELPAFQMQGLGQKSWKDFLASHSRPDSVLCVHSTTFLPGRREGEPHIH